MVCIVGEPKRSVTLSGEGGGNPRVLVREIPDGNSDTAVHGKTSRNDVRVVGSLLSETGAGLRETGESDVELGVGNFDAECGVALEDGG